MHTNNKSIFGFLYFFCTLLIGCTPPYKPPHGAGKLTEVIVISEQDLYSEVESLLVNTLGRVIYTPTTEHIFDIKVVSPQELYKFKYRQNCLILGLIGDTLIEELLAPSAMNELLSGKSYVFGSDSLFVQGQSVLIISAPTTYKLAEVIRDNSELIFNYFAEGVRKHIKAILYKDGYQEKLASELKSKYGFSIHIPEGWIWANNEFGFIEFIHHNPDRIISIYWESTPELELDKAQAISLRNKIGKLYYDGDYVNDSLTNFYWVNFHSQTSAKLDGIWQNDEKVMGGPFRSYVFWLNGRLYVIDMHIFAPGEKKWKWLQQLELICDTFSGG